MLQCFAQFTKNAGKDQWSKVGIALVNGGGVRSSIDERALNGIIILNLQFLKRAFLKKLHFNF